VLLIVHVHFSDFLQGKHGRTCFARPDIRSIEGAVAFRWRSARIRVWAPVLLRSHMCRCVVPGVKLPITDPILTDPVKTLLHVLFAFCPRRERGQASTARVMDRILDLRQREFFVRLLRGNPLLCEGSWVAVRFSEIVERRGGNSYPLLISRVAEGGKSYALRILLVEH
jgi:hypothetical protein